MVSVTLVHAPVLSHYLRYTATTAGRDKLLRMVQYFSRLCSTVLHRLNYSQSTIESFKSLQRQFGRVRMILRIGSFLENLITAVRTLGDKDPVDPILRFLSIGSQLGYVCYLTLDTIMVFHIMGVYNLTSAKQLASTANRSWAAALLCSIISSSYILLASPRQVGDSRAVHGETTKEHSTARIQLVTDLCDLTMPTSDLAPARIDDSLVSLAGTISSLISVRNHWRKTA
ncbi:hypothetical protein N7497_006146 [Penicillium chrysogenum]|nr:hypothetical protein N7497_006119 [Penicillium chrysogenum]KAJ6157261.1 hypothetical protein N7497_006146 [Penicillium chrysogenum]